MFTFDKYNNNDTLSISLENAVGAAIESGTLIFLEAGVPTVAVKGTEASKELYILAEKLVPEATNDRERGRKNTAVFYRIRKNYDTVCSLYKTTLRGGAPTVGLDVQVDNGKNVEAVSGGVARFTIAAVGEKYSDGRNDFYKVILNKK